MDVQRDFAELCWLLNARGAEFLIVGGYAVAHHGAPRFTGDLDILIRPAVESVEQMLSVLGEFFILQQSGTVSSSLFLVFLLFLWLALLNGNQFDLENQGRIGADEATRSALTIGKIRRNKELPFRPLSHERQCLGPTGDHA